MGPPGTAIAALTRRSHGGLLTNIANLPLLVECGIESGTRHSDPVSSRLNVVCWIYIK